MRFSSVRIFLKDTGIFWFFYLFLPALQASHGQEPTQNIIPQEGTMTHFLVLVFLLVFFLCNLSYGENGGPSSVTKKKYRPSKTDRGPEDYLIDIQNSFKNSVNRSKRFAVHQSSSSSLSPDIVFSESSSSNPCDNKECNIMSVHNKQDTSCGVWKESYDSSSIYIYELPWQALLVLTKANRAFCSATIISEDAVITSENCISGLQSKDIVVKAGKGIFSSQKDSKSFQVRPVMAIAKLQCSEIAIAKDLAILKLEQPFMFNDNVGEICIPSFPSPWHLLTNRTCIVTGWGKDVLQGFGNNSAIHKVKVKDVPIDDCILKLKQDKSEEGSYFINNIRKGFICATPSSGLLYDLCKVDYGSSLICDRGDGHYELVGIKRWDFGCKGDVPSIITTCISTWTRASVNNITLIDLNSKIINGFLVANQLFNKVLKKLKN